MSSLPIKLTNGTGILLFSLTNRLATSLWCAIHRSVFRLAICCLRDFVSGFLKHLSHKFLFTRGPGQKSKTSFCALKAPCCTASLLALLCNVRNSVRRSAVKVTMFLDSSGMLLDIRSLVLFPRNSVLDEFKSVFRWLRILWSVARLNYSWSA